jgi:rhodanese-related sulfurtransferase
MIKQISSSEVEAHTKSNPKSVLLDVRTELEWDTDGRPDGEKFGIKTYFLTIKDENFIGDFNKLSISRDYEVLCICKAGARSHAVTELLSNENYKCVNIHDGIDGWKNASLPCK